MVVTKSKSHPNLLFYGRRGELNRTSSNSSGDYCGDSVSSLELCYEKTCTSTDFNSLKNAIDTNVIGGLLWKLLLTKELSVSLVPAEQWKDLQEKHSTLSKCSIPELQRYHKALASIVIMDPSIDPRANDLLEEYNGRLTSINETVTRELSLQSPDTFTAFVADFNDNLAYQMKNTRGFPAQPHSNHVSQSQWEEQLHELQDNLQTTLNSTTELEIQGSFLKTEYKTIAQPPHVDFPWKTLQQDGHNLWLAFFGLTQEGMILQLWPDKVIQQNENCQQGQGQGQGQLVFIPLGKILLMPSHTIHGGGFRTQPIFHPNDHGNVRYHLYLATDGASLPRFANNVYTLPNDCSKELSRVCLNAPYLEEGEAHDEEDGVLLSDLLLD